MTDIMKKIALVLFTMMAVSFSVKAQSFAMIDMEYILQNVQSYENATKEIDEASKKWQSEVENLSNEAKSLYEKYQSAKNLTEAQRTTQENNIVEKEKAAAELRRKYFGSEGELAKMRQEKIQPIMDEIYEIVKAIAQKDGIEVVIDRASASSVIFASPEIDISDEILQQLGKN